MTAKSGKIIHNVATLDLRNATAAAIAEIQRVDNAATILYSAETAEFVAGMTIGNVASMIKVPAAARLIIGSKKMEQGAFTEHSTPIDLIVVGQLIIEQGVTVEEVRAGLNTLRVYGQLLYPEHLSGIIQAKLLEMTGQGMSYAANAKLVMGKLELTETLLRGLEDNTEFLIFGSLLATQLLPNDLLAQKLKKVEVLGKVSCHEENAAVLLARTTGGQPVIIPSGFTYLDKPLVLDATSLEALPGKKLYAQSLRVEPDVTAAALDSALDALILTGTLIAPSAVRSVLGRKVKLIETEAIFYEGELWLVESEMTLQPERFDYLEGKATLAVYGELSIAPEVEPKQLAQHFHKVYNWGEIRCTPAQMSALQARLGSNKGEFVHPTAPAHADETENVIGNAAYMAL